MICGPTDTLAQLVRVEERAPTRPGGLSRLPGWATERVIGVRRQAPHPGRSQRWREARQHAELLVRATSRWGLGGRRSMMRKGANLWLFWPFVY